MKKALIIVAAIILLLVLGAMAYLFYAKSKQPASAIPVTFPVASTTQGVGDPRSVGSVNGGSLITKDFINDGVTIEDPANAGSYYLVGTTGYCYDDGTCAQAGSGEKPFNIVYFSSEGSFVVGLKEEPLGDVRKQAEQYLKEALGISDQQMCTLNYYIGTTIDVNSVYGEMGNLGFSFCPNAVKLP